MKKKILAALITIVSVAAGAISAVLVFFSPSSQTPTTASKATSSSSTSTSQSSLVESSTSSVATATSSSTSAEATSATGLTDGTYTGAVTSTNRGNYQVQMTVSGGVITDITILEYPSDNPTSESINANALPTYTAEVLTSQSTDINAISGATEAFNGFTGSLQDAINQAQA